MSRSSIYQSIRNCESRIDGCNAQISQLRQRIEDLWQLKNGYLDMQSSLGEFQSKKRLQTSSLQQKSAKIKFARIQSTIMADMLDSVESKQAENGIGEAVQKIDTEIQNAENRIESLQADISYHQNRISDLYYQLSQLEN